MCIVNVQMMSHKAKVYACVVSAVCSERLLVHIDLVLCFLHGSLVVFLLHDLDLVCRGSDM